MPKPVRLTTSLRERVWGRTHLAPWFPDAAKPTGEAWYLLETDLQEPDLPETDLPLLVKLLFTSERLSVQVHPDDGEDGPRGKSEMWHIMDAEPGATIALGFRQPISRDRLWDATRTGEIEALLNWVPVKAGETYYTPAHTVHAIGAGIVLCEIQQNSDVTYRLWDYGRPREMHIDKGVPIADLGVHPGAAHPVALGAGREELVRCRHFVTELLHMGPGDTFAATPQECQLWICLAGAGTIEGEAFQAGEVWWLPAAGEVKAEAGARLLRTYVP